MPTGKKGFIPTANYFDRKYNRWTPSYLISMSIGQGEILTTPIQMANMIAIIANRGYYYTPHTVRNKELHDFGRFDTQHIIDIQLEHFETVIKGMEMVVSDEILGSANNINQIPVPIFGKTGTVQNQSGNDHSVFVAFSPKKNPTIAIAVIVENAGWGAKTAAPIAALMIEKYINKTISNLDIERSIINKKVNN